MHIVNNQDDLTYFSCKNVFDLCSETKITFYMISKQHKTRNIFFYNKYINFSYLKKITQNLEEHTPHLMYHNSKATITTDYLSKVINFGIHNNILC